MSDGRGWIALAVAAWSAVGGIGWALVHGRARREQPREPLPPGYGERYHYRSYFDPDDPWTPEDLWGIAEHMQPDVLAPFPEDQDEPTNVIAAYHRFTACKVCGFRARICSSAACPQRKVQP